MLTGYVHGSTSTRYAVVSFSPRSRSDPLVLITGLPFLSYAKMCICEQCLAGNIEGTMTKFASGSTADLSGMPSRDFGSIQIFSIGT